MATAASDYLSVNLSIIVSTLGISESLAGVTIFAFGNGSSDLFSTLAAMNADSGGLAITELFGAAAFITTVVLGLVAVTRPFSVDPSIFIGDVVWFVLLTSCLMAFLADGQLQLRECLGIVGLYLAFVAYALLRPNRSQADARAATTSVSSADATAATTDISNVNVFGGEQSDETTGLLSLSGPFAEESTEQNFGVDSVRTVSSISTNTHTEGTSSFPIFSGFGLAFIKIFPRIDTWSMQSMGEKALTLFSLPLLLPIGLTTPIDLEKLDSTADGPVRSASSTAEPSATVNSDTIWPQSNGIKRYKTLKPRSWVLCVQFLFGPQLLAFVFVSQTSIVDVTPANFGLAALWALPLSGLLITFHLAVHHPSLTSQLAVSNHFFNATFAFAISLAWIYLTATSIVTLLKTIGLVLDIPEAILGATVFAIGNSSNDLVANPAVAKRGFPVLAASACFGGPMMNMLLGIGIGGMVQVLKGGSDASYSFEVSTSLFISAANLLLALCVILVYTYHNSWRLDKRLGLVLVGIWSAFTVANVMPGMVKPSSKVR